MGWECTRRQEKPFKAIKTKKQGGLSAKPLNAINQAVSYQAEKVRTSFFSPVLEGPAFPFQKLIVPETVNMFFSLKVPGQVMLRILIVIGPESDHWLCLSLTP